MKTSKFLPAGFVALMMIGAGAVVATAQTATNEQAQQDQPDRPMMGDVPHRAHDRGDHGVRGGPKHHMGRMGGGMFRTIFDTVDADSDGMVTREEIDTYRASRVSDADESGDGVLSIEEFDELYREFTRSRMVDAFQSLDNDGDGTISAEEMDNRVSRLVEHLDHDGDGALSLKRGPKGD